MRRRSLPWWAGALAVAADAVWLRRRAATLPALVPQAAGGPGAAAAHAGDVPDRDAPPGGAGAGAEPDAGWVWLPQPPAAEVRAAVARWAAANGAEAVDVVAPGSPARVMARVRWAGPALRPGAPFLRPSTHPDVLGLHPDLVRRLGGAGALTGSLLEVAQRARASGPARFRAVVSPLRQPPVPGGTGAGEAWEEARARFGPLAPAALLAPAAGTAALAAGAAVAPLAAATAALAWQLAPMVVGGGTPLRERAPAGRPAVAGRRRRGGSSRWLRGWRDGTGTALRALAEGRRRRWRTAPGGPPASPPGADPYGPLRTGETLLEPRRTTCPLCGGGALRRVLSSPDMLQGKPGRFHLERCGDCGHVFQNPRCTEAALDLYYRDFYDGLGAELADMLFAATDAVYRQRAAMAGDGPPPARWLDVGCGMGHFAAAARSSLPGTRFEGADLGAGVGEGARRGWLDAAHRGRLPELAGSLAGRFDVVSLFHSLEHTRDPVAELRAVADVLVPGGLLLVELPNPQCAGARRFGRHWLPWFQPQHQHLPPRAALCRVLDGLGFTVERAWAVPDPVSLDAVTAVALWLHRAAPPPGLPWSPPGERAAAARLRRLAAYGALVVVAPLALLVDQLLAFATPPSRRASAYRVVARWPGSPAPPGPAAGGRP